MALVADGQNTSTLGLLDILIVTPFLAGVDFIEFLLLMFGLDDFWITDILAFPVTQLYLFLRGARGTYSLVTQGFELVPYVGWLPLRTVGFLLTVWVSRHPRVAQTVQVAARRRPTPLRAALPRPPRMSAQTPRPSVRDIAAAPQR